MDAFISVVEHMPEKLLRDGKDLAAMLESHVESYPDYWLTPIPLAVAADFMNTTSSALYTRRSRGTAPPSYIMTGETGKSRDVMFESRLSIVLWQREQMGLKQAEADRRLVAKIERQNAREAGLHCADAHMSEKADNLQEVA